MSLIGIAYMNFNKFSTDDRRTSFGRKCQRRLFITQVEMSLTGHKPYELPMISADEHDLFGRRKCQKTFITGGNVTDKDMSLYERSKSFQL
ncbi:hypothetical protein AVEN_153164-1 [Araneus ventricosus]|uniref:Uncharacterized protein n=1 Tax=Araneus ventricosus TaxID=182803 RepID=A0A4Y2BI09_ARAVE|nr:hypothetical protein AVEN_153164-1 [Araneus ventricosus]